MYIHGWKFLYNILTFQIPTVASKILYWHINAPRVSHPTPIVTTIHLFFYRYDIISLFWTICQTISFCNGHLINQQILFRHYFTNCFKKNIILLIIIIHNKNTHSCVFHVFEFETPHRPVATVTAARNTLNLSVWEVNISCIGIWLEAILKVKYTGHTNETNKNIKTLFVPPQ